jgi:hypothetical protein
MLTVMVGQMDDVLLPNSAGGQPVARRGREPWREFARAVHQVLMLAWGLSDSREPAPRVIRA